MRIPLSLIVTVAMALGAVPTAAPAGEHMHFVPEASSVTLTDDGVRVVFRESGLAPGEQTEIEVAVSVTDTVTCRAGDSGSVLMRFSSTASALESTSYVADETGSVAGERLLAVRPGSVEITGWTCSTHTEATATLRDVANGATLTLTSATS